MTSYIISHHTEETGCDGCGYPLYLGDRAHESEQTGRVYCCAACMKQYDAPRHAHAAPITDAACAHV